MLVSSEWLANHLDQPDLRILDCRFSLQDASYGRRAYEREHIPNAAFLDLEEDLSAPVIDTKQGGRHPLPDPFRLVERLGQLGIDERSRVVVYDDDGGMFAGRAWWLLTYLGHPHVQLLEQGWQGWKEHGFPTEKRVPSFPQRTFPPRLQYQMVADRAEVENKIGASDVVLIDSRAEARYRGEEEPLDPIAGHIPSAKSFFWEGVRDEQKRWKAAEDLKKHFAPLSPDQEVIVYCGSGVSATPNIMALYRAGFTNVKLYPGGWSEWVSDPQASVETGDGKSHQEK